MSIYAIQTCWWPPRSLSCCPQHKTFPTSKRLEHMSSDPIVTESMDLTLKPKMWQNTLVPFPLGIKAQPQPDYCFPPKTDRCSQNASLTLRPKVGSLNLPLSSRRIASSTNPEFSQRDGKDEITLIVDEMDGFDAVAFDRRMAEMAQEGSVGPFTPLQEELEPKFSPRQWWGEVGKRCKDERFADIDLHTSTSITMVDSDLNALSRRNSQLPSAPMGALASGSNTRRSSACVPVQIGRRSSGMESFAELVRQRASVPLSSEEDGPPQVRLQERSYCTAPRLDTNVLESSARLSHHPLSQTGPFLSGYLEGFQIALELHSSGSQSMNVARQAVL
jgi:hypothetical protein